MRFMMLVRHAENCGCPPKELMEAIGKLGSEAVKAGQMLANGGLAPTAQSTRVRVSKGQLNVIDGPFAEAKEVIGGYAEFELKSKEEVFGSSGRGFHGAASEILAGVGVARLRSWEAGSSGRETS